MCVELGRRMLRKELENPKQREQQGTAGAKCLRQERLQCWGRKSGWSLVGRVGKP